jgi:hypothetical protein
MFRNWIHRLFASSSEGRISSSRSVRPRARLSMLSLEDRVVPAIVFVDPTFTGTPGSTVTFNAGRPGEVGGLTLGQNAFADLGDAVTAAVAGDTVQLAQATIATDVNFEINESLNFVGSGIGLTILTPNASTAADFGDTGAWLKIIGGANVGFSFITFDGLASTFGIGEAVRYDGASGLVDSVAFSNVSRAITGNIYEGVGVVVRESTVTVQNSSFSNMGHAGAIFTEALTNGTFSNNIYTGKGAGDFLDVGVEVSFGASALISGNTFTNALGEVSADGSDSTAILVTDPGTNVIALGNMITNNRVGAIVGFDTNDTPTATFNFNNFINNQEAAISTTVAVGSEVDATQNFFGTTNGPEAPQNPGGSGDFIFDETGVTILGPFLREETPVAAANSGPSYISAVTPPEIYAVGAGAGAGPHVRVFQNNVEIASFFAYGSGFLGGVRVAIGDVDGDGIDDIITAAGAGAGPHIKVFSLNGTEKLSFFAYGSGFIGGVHLAVGDIDGDAIDDIVTGAGPGAGPHVKAFDGRTGAEKLSYFAFESGYQGGITVGTGDTNFDFVDEIIVGALEVAPHVTIFNGTNGALMASFFAFEPAVGRGIFVSSGDIDGDGTFEIFAGLSSGLGQIAVLTANGVTMNQFNVDSSVGVRVAGVDLPGDGPELLLVGFGEGRPSNIRFLDPNTGLDVLSSSIFPVSLPGGIFVG